MAERARRVSGPLWTCAALAAGLLAVVLVVALPAVPHPIVVAVADLAEVAFAAAAALCCWYASRGCLPRRRRAWSCLAVASGCWAAGQAYWAAAELLLHMQAPFPSPADAGYLAMPVAAAVGLWLFAERPGSGRRQLLDGLLVATAVALVSWQTALGAVFKAGGESWFGAAVSLAYPAGDVVLLTMTVLALAQGRRQRVTLAVLAAGLVAVALADGAFAYANAVSSYSTGSPVDVGWCAGFALIAVAGLVARRSPESDEGDAEPGQQVAAAAMLPYLPVAVASVVVLGRYLGGHGLDGTSFGLTAVLVAVVMLRQYATVLDNQRLASTLAERESQLRHRAFHDALTGLANRALFNDRLAHALELRRRDPEALAVVFVDLDGFKGINDTLGHAVGDELLVRVAERLRGALRVGDTLARLGGDEFAVLLEHCEEPAEVAGHLVEAFRAPFRLAERAVNMTVSVGVAAVPAGQAPADAGALLRQADMAMYAVKRSGRNNFRLHTPELRIDEVDDLSLHRALAAALHDGQVTAHYQPIVDVASGEVRGLEALARWEHDGRQVPPAVFVPVAERGGLVSALTDLMLDRALGALGAWDADRGDGSLHVAVNVSRHELTQAELPARVAAALARHGQPGRRLVLEVTESGLTDDVVAARNTLVCLREQGVLIALDDFGTGYNSLAQLLHIPLDIVKIDRLFVRDVDRSPQRQKLLAGLLAVADRLGLLVVAEGVETVEELQHLRATGVTCAQGFLLGRPSPDGVGSGAVGSGAVRSGAVD